MPMYYKLCEECSSEEEKLIPYTTFIEHNSKETPCQCDKCGAITAFYSLSRLSTNLKADLDTIQPCVIRTENAAYKYMTGFAKRGE